MDNSNPLVNESLLSSWTPTYASFSARFSAVFIDSLILAAIGLVIAFAFVFIDRLIMENLPGNEFLGTILVKSAAQIISYAIYLFYMIYFIGKKGATPGKKLAGIKVVKIGKPGEGIGYSGIL